MGVSHEEVRREDDEILRQLQSTQACISIWSLLASSSAHRDTLIRLEPDSRGDHHYPGGVDSYDDGRQGHMYCHKFHPSVGNGSALNVCPLATAIALGYAPLAFGPSTQTVRAYDSTKSEVMGTLMIELLIGPTTFPKYSRFTFDKVQTLEVGDFCRDLVICHLINIAFVATVDHDTPFGLGFVPIEANYRMSLADYFIRGSKLGDETFDAPISVMIALHHQIEPTSYHLSDEKDMSMNQIVEMVQPEPASSFNIFGVFAIEIVRRSRQFCLQSLWRMLQLVMMSLRTLLDLLRKGPTL
ncbi:hypothetical protein CK203_107723 [Vitis vinifera]|uniref:Uncharacterized protein n=1 Tax=Vitis vinifera TaxID=29760 RepID=A0A438CIK3_VITVI|nr:hypothetical protein CK203_107723 [Vitis vinifera]